jgi:hypothetical protein
VFPSDLPGVNPATLNGMLLYYRLKTKWSGLGDSTELYRVGLSQVGEFFEVRAQVDRDLTPVSWVDRLLGLIKNLGRHSLPPLNGISSRDSI